MPKFLTTKEFIKRAKAKHGSRYGYSLVEYVSAKEPIIIVCKLHGEFVQLPNSHLNGAQCRKCSDSERVIPLKEVLARFRKVHGKRYDYSKISYTDTKGSIDIVCAVHGVFSQAVINHLRGNGCPQCSIFGGLGLERWLVKVKALHGDKYSYDKAIYVNGDTKLIITCRIHGDFLQCAGDHGVGRGCPKCGRANKKISTKEWITKAKLTHGLRFDYSNVDYQGSKEYVTIHCPVHGEFKQKPGNHIKTGCRRFSVTSNTEEFIKNSRLLH